MQENLHQLASILEAQKKYDEAVATAARALAINKEVLGADHPQVGISLQILGRIHASQGSYEEAQAALRESIAILERSLGAQHRLLAFLADSLRLYAAVLNKSGREAEAKDVERRLRQMEP